MHSSIDPWYLDCHEGDLQGLNKSFYYMPYFIYEIEYWKDFDWRVGTY